MWVIFVVPAVIATVAVVALGISVWPRLNLVYVFLVLCVAGLWIQIVSAARIGRTGATELDLRRHQLQRASGTAGAYDVTEHLDAYAALTDELPLAPASVELPALIPLVEEVAARVGLPRTPEVSLTRGGWTVIVNHDASKVGVATGFLLVASIDEVRAELARHLAPHARPERMVALRAARVAVTAGRWRAPGISSRLDFVFWPAAQVAGAIERAARPLAATVRSDAERTATALYGAESVGRAMARSAVSPVLWRTHLGQHQRDWTASGSAVAPHELWPQVWAEVHTTGQTVTPDVADLVDPCALLGWVPAPPPALAVPPAAPVPAFYALAGTAAPVSVRNLDTTSASQYYGEPVNRRFGELGSPILDDDEAPTGSLDGQPLPLAIDPGLPAPHLTLILEQLDVLELAIVRRDVHALAAAQAIDAVAQAPTVRAMAAGVRWLCGDPDGLDRIRQSLVDAPRGAGALVDLIGPLRAAGEDDVAVAVQRATDDLVLAIESRFNLRHLFGLGPKLVEPDMPADVRAALQEIASDYPKDARAWLAEVDRGSSPGSGAVRPAVLLARPSFFTLRPWSGTTGSIAASSGMVNAVWPVTRIIDASDVEFVRRAQLRRRFARLT